MKYKYTFFIILFLILFFLACEEKPTFIDRRANAEFIVIDTSGILEKDPLTNIRLMKNSDVIFYALDYNQTFKFKTNDYGIVKASGLLASKYTISISNQITDNFSIFGSKELNIYGTSITLDTIFLRSIPSSSIIINELYYCGPINNVNYYSDLFIELYNNGNELQYLDGIIVGVVSEIDETNFLGILDLGNNITGVKLFNAFQFPGIPGGKQYPIYPGQFVVIAGDAIDHRKIPNCGSSIDLSPSNPIFSIFNPDHAQLWEFYNPYSTDIDVINVPKVSNVLPTTTLDFELNLNFDAVVISSSKKGLIYQNDHIYIDLTTVLDGVQYLSYPNHYRKIDGRIDAGTAGVGIPKYSGKSIERIIVDPKNPKKHSDNNNSTVDFGVNDRPTPGYQGNPKK
jgi:hypothetical protein